MKQVLNWRIAFCSILVFGAAGGQAQHVTTASVTSGGQTEFQDIAHAVPPPKPVLPTYSIQSISLPPGSPPLHSITGINDLGHVIGNIRGQSLNGFFWANGVTTVLPAMGGGGGLYAWRINNSDIVVGYGSIPTVRINNINYNPDHAFVWSASDGLRDIHLGPVQNNSFANGVTDAGQVIGLASGNAGTPGWYQWFNGAATYLPALSGFQWIDPYAVSNSGVIVARGVYPSYARQPLMYAGGALTILTSSGGTPYGVNDLKQTVGDDQGPVFWNANGAKIALTAVPGTYAYRAVAINNSGVIVGDGYSSNDYVALYWPNATSPGIDMNSLLNSEQASGWKLTVARGINRWGQITGYGDFKGVETGFVLTPVPQLAVDANRDGEIHFGSEVTDPSKSDATSADKPYRFWINDDVDRHDQVDASGNFAGFDVQDDLNPTKHNGDLDWQLNTVSGTRDLEDWARLWINIGGLQDMIASGQISIGLKWTTVTAGTPAIKLVRACETDGGATYLTSTAVASAQVTGSYGNAVIDASNSSSTLIAPPASGTRDWDFVIPTAALGNFSVSNPTAHFLFEGCQRGKGQLSIVLLKNEGGTYTKIADGPGFWLDLKNIKEMYERWTVGDGLAANFFTGAGGGGEPANAATISQDRLPSGVSGLTYSFPVQAPEQNQYILLVHGWNMHPWEKDAFAETAFKRLYWQGYQGRFGSFQWPTTYHDHDASAATDYDEGEYTAWLTATPLKNLLVSLHASQHYGPNVYVVAHSMGNVVTGEALRLAVAAGAGQVVNTYVASQAAIPGQCYDPAVTIANPLGFGLLGVYGPKTPNIYDNWLATNSGGVGTKANFYNINDFALDGTHWQLDQDLKPDVLAGHWTGTAPNDIGPPYGYIGSSSAAPAQTGFYKTTYGPDPNNSGSHVKLGTLSLSLEDRNSAGTVTNLNDRYEIMAFAAEPRSLALGTIPSVGGMVAQNLQNIWPLDPFNPSQEPSSNYSSHPWHSAEFRFDNMAQANYWSSLLVAFHLISNNQ